MSEIRELYPGKIKERKNILIDLFTTVGREEGIERVLRNVYSTLNTIRLHYIFPDEKFITDILIDLEATIEICDAN